MVYIDHFNTETSQYQQFRPTYPDELFDYLLEQIGQCAWVWDCATGNGQAAISLAKRFEQVIATDINKEQLAIAIQQPNIDYRLCPAEKTNLNSQSIDLVTIAQALHWFDLPAFYQEVRRVVKPDGWIAAWCYSLGHIEPAVDEIIHKLYYRILGDEYWPKERRYIDEAYETIYFPFIRQNTPEFSIEKTLNLNHFLGYLSTWSAVKEYQQKNGVNPITLIQKDLQMVWGDKNIYKTIYYPLHLIVGNLSQYQGDQ